MLIIAHIFLFWYIDFFQGKWQQCAKLYFFFWCRLLFTADSFACGVSWTAVATWRWVANDDSCGICRMPFDGCCPDCKIPGDDCPLGKFFLYKLITWSLEVLEKHFLCRVFFLFSLGWMFSLLSHSLYRKMAELATQPTVSNVSSGLEVQRMSW